MMPQKPLLIINIYRDSRFMLVTLLACLAALFSTQATGQDRWFQIEATVFTNESKFARDSEYWLPNQPELRFPSNIRRLANIQDNLLIEAFLTAEDRSQEGAALPNDETLRGQRILRMGPEPERTTGGFRMFDLLRDEYLNLPTSLSDFSQTNRALERSPDHKLLFHGHWRQRVVSSEEATSIYIEDLRERNSRPNLNGSLTIRFNEQEDRVVVDANLWLIETAGAIENGTEWRLPEMPAVLNDPTKGETQSTTNSDRSLRIYPMQQSREMRSNEFHYLDHPALGLIIAVRPYNPPID
jgi:hypothetical protein